MHDAKRRSLRPNSTPAPSATLKQAVAPPLRTAERIAEAPAATTRPAAKGQPPAPNPERPAPTRRTIAQRFRQRNDWRQSREYRRRFLPSWLASLVLHAALVIALASWLVPVSKNSFAHPLLLFFATAQAQSPQSEIDARPVLIAQAAAMRGGDESAVAPTPPASKLDPAPFDPAPLETAPPQTAPPAEPATAIEPRPVTEPRPTAVAIEPQRSAVAATPAPNSAYATGQSDRADRAGRLARFTAGLALPPELSAEMLESSPEQRRIDEVVNQFIQFDIGQLGGAEGARAKQEFDRLGAESIPALVRGLNRSASIHASCPVCVISNKLNHALRQSNSQSLFGYALANIGRDVPHTAPHYWRLESLLQSLTVSTDGLLVLLDSPDPQVQLDGIEQIIKEHAAFTLPNKLRVAGPLTGLIESGSPEMRLATHRAMVLVAGKAVGLPSEETLIRDSFESAQQWRTFWNRAEHVSRLKTALPAALVKSLEDSDPIVCQAGCDTIAARTSSLADSHRLLFARALVRLLSSEEQTTRDCAQGALLALSQQPAPSVPWTAERWQAYWDVFSHDHLIEPRAKSYLALARHLETRGQRQQAAERYRKIIEDYPLSEAAGHAQQRLDKLLTAR